MSRIGELIKNIFIKSDDIESDQIDTNVQLEQIDAYTDEAEEIKKELKNSLIYIDDRFMHEAENELKRALKENKKEKTINANSITKVAEVSKLVEEIDEEKDIGEK